MTFKDVAVKKYVVRLKYYLLIFSILYCSFAESYSKSR
jgi:hypothetical protein